MTQIMRKNILQIAFIFSLDSIKNILRNRQPIKIDGIWSVAFFKFFDKISNCWLQMKMRKNKKETHTVKEIQFQFSKRMLFTTEHVHLHFEASLIWAKHHKIYNKLAHILDEHTSRKCAIRWHLSHVFHISKWINEYERKNFLFFMSIPFVFQYDQNNTTAHICL